MSSLRAVVRSSEFAGSGSHKLDFAPRIEKGRSVCAFCSSTCLSTPVKDVRALYAASSFGCLIHCPHDSDVVISYQPTSVDSAKSNVLLLQATFTGMSEAARHPDAVALLTMTLRRTTPSLAFHLQVRASTFVMASRRLLDEAALI